MSETSQPLPQRVIAVLGMHRSGTSCVTGSLQNYGLYLGEHSTWNRHNTRGNRENQSIVDLNDAILAANGGDWLHPPAEVVWQPEHTERARDILSEYADQALFGFKDPRTLITLDGWKAILGDRLSFIGTFRNPESVVKSILVRDHNTAEEAWNAWRAYNLALLQRHTAQRFPLLCFDWPQEKFESRLVRAARRMGLEQQSDESFYSSELRHHDPMDVNGLSAEDRALYTKLSKRCSWYAALLS